MFSGSVIKRSRMKIRIGQVVLLGFVFGMFSISSDFPALADNEIKINNDLHRQAQMQNMQRTSNALHPAHYTVQVPENYPIPVVFKQNVDSETAQNGDTIAISTASDIYINNKLVFSKNASGYAIIKSVRPARNLGKYGFIIIKKGYLADTTGTLRQVKFETKIKGERCQWAGIIGHAMIWNPIGWIVALKEGTPAELKAGDTATCINEISFNL